MQPLRLLVIEDSEDDYLLLLRQLEQAKLSCASTRVSSADALKRVLDQPWDMIISDYSLPDFSGIEALSIVRKRSLEAPFILLSGVIGEDKAVEAMKAGAQDYIMKGNSTRLIPAMERELREFASRQKAKAELREREAQLLQAQKMEAIGLLAGGLAHDFNNILGVIHCHVDMILDELNNVQVVQSNAQGILSAAERASALVRKLLAFGRRQVMEPRSVNLNAVLQSAEDMIRLTVGSRCELEFDLDHTIPTIMADPVQVEQIIMNLAVNARDAMTENGKLQFQTAHSKKGVKLCVRDNGSGMTPEVRARIFEPYFTTKGEGKGTGLGLPTVFGIVKQLKGEIFVESEPGVGTVFQLIFPAEEKVKRLNEHDTKRQTPTKKIMLVKEDAALRKALSELLKDHGYAVFESGDSSEALSVFAKTLPDLVISDMQLHRLSASNMMHELRQEKNSLPILFMAATSDSSEVPIDDKLNYLILKPFNGPMLLKQVEEILAPTSK